MRFARLMVVALVALFFLSTARAQNGRKTLTRKGVTTLDYVRQTDVEGARRINGAIFQSDLDITNPIGFGVNDRRLFINKNGPTILVPSRNRYATVAKYTAGSFVNGYASKDNIARVDNSAAIVTSNEGTGTVILFADDPTYGSGTIRQYRILGDRTTG